MEKFEVMEVDPIELKKLTDGILDVGKAHGPDPKLFLLALKVVEAVIAKDLENGEECDCVNCVAMRSGKKKVNNQNNYKETLH